mmetsp:Transcript_47394/g.93227  ORF Transcript_47394/g.93227 Transcript_47394/m.93227 type:complete len:251 (+) Transcript_47394:2440-3192(+)
MALSTSWIWMRRQSPHHLSRREECHLRHRTHLILPIPLCLRTHPRTTTTKATAKLRARPTHLRKLLCLSLLTHLILLTRRVTLHPALRWMSLTTTRLITTLSHLTLQMIQRHHMAITSRRIHPAALPQPHLTPLPHPTPLTTTLKTTWKAMRIRRVAKCCQPFALVSPCGSKTTIGLHKIEMMTTRRKKKGMQLSLSASTVTALTSSNLKTQRRRGLFPNRVSRQLFPKIMTTFLSSVESTRRRKLRLWV